MNNWEFGRLLEKKKNTETKSAMKTTSTFSAVSLENVQNHNFPQLLKRNKGHTQTETFLS